MRRRLCVRNLRDCELLTKSSVFPVSFGLNNQGFEFYHGGLVCAIGGLHVTRSPRWSACLFNILCNLVVRF